MLIIRMAHSLHSRSPTVHTSAHTILMCLCVQPLLLINKTGETYITSLSNYLLMSIIYYDILGIVVGSHNDAHAHNKQTHKHTYTLKVEVTCVSSDAPATQLYATVIHFAATNNLCTCNGINTCKRRRKSDYSN